MKWSNWFFCLLVSFYSCHCCSHFSKIQIINGFGFISNLHDDSFGAFICYIWTKKTVSKINRLILGLVVDTYTCCFNHVGRDRRTCIKLFFVVITIFVKEIFYTWFKPHQKSRKMFASCWVLEVDLRQNLFLFFEK